MSDVSQIESFEQLLALSRVQEEPQRLLFVFARRELGEHATAIQRERYAQGSGGFLQPVLCVDKAPAEIDGLAGLVAESEHTGQAWDVMFVSSMDGRGGVAPNPDQADQPLRFMVQAIHEGRVGELAAFDRDGHALRFVQNPQGKP